jgi:hypothetical protein
MSNVYLGWTPATNPIRGCARRATRTRLESVSTGKVRDVRDYAALVAELSRGGDAGEVLARWGLDDASFTSVEEHYQGELSKAMDATDDGVPPLVAEYAAAFAAARAEQPSSDARPRLDLDEFARATRAIQRKGDAVSALRELGIEVGDYLAASQHWTPRIASDPVLAARFLERPKGSR